HNIDTLSPKKIGARFRMAPIRRAILAVITIIFQILPITMVSRADQSPAPQLNPTSNRLSLSNLPLWFEQNSGQTAGDVEYLAHGNGFNLFLRADRAVFSRA